MARITGAQSILAFKLGTTGTAYATAVALTTGNLCPFSSFTYNENAQELSNSPLGLGKVMQTDIIRGNTEPSGTLEKVMGFNDPGIDMLAQFFGTAGSPTEQTPSRVP